MCGIAGLIGDWPSLCKTSFRDLAYKHLSHRGPNGRGAISVKADFSGFIDSSHGEIHEGGCGLLVHTRLSVVDLSSAGAQPMINRCGRSAIVFNGEIYNYESIAKKIGLCSRDLRGHSDTEVLLNWLDKNPNGCLEDHDGMFAFAYIDLNSRQIILARDAFGIKPLYFAQHKNAWAFASEPQMLTLLPGIGRDINKIQAFETIRYGDQISINRNTIFSKVQKLLPGEKLVINLKSPSKFEWQEWYRPKPRKQFEGSFSDAVSEFKKYFVESVRLQMKSEVQIGAGLSGGLDSSSVVAAMHLNGGDKINITTVSHIAQSANKSEEKWVDIFNQSYKTVSRKTRPKNDDLINEIDSLILHQGEPFGTTSIYAQHCVYRKAKEINLTVMLEGQGADELLGGYDYYLSFYLLELFKTGQMHEFFRRLTQIALTSTKSLHLHLIRLISLGVHPRIVDQVREISGFPGMPNWVQKCELKSYYSRVGPLSSEFGSTLQGALIHTLRSSLVNLFRYCDRNSMAFSVEARVPFMSLPLVNFIHSLPAKYLIGPNGETKYILRSAMRGLVPDLIIDRPDKIGFENDEQKLLVSMTPWVEEALQNDVDRCHLINRDRLRTSWNQFKNGRYSVAPRLWYTLIMLRWFSLNKTGI